MAKRVDSKRRLKIGEFEFASVGPDKAEITFSGVDPPEGATRVRASGFISRDDLQRILNWMDHLTQPSPSSDPD